MKQVKGNPDYRPTAKELGISNSEFDRLDMDNPEELDRMVNLFNQKAMYKREEKKKNAAINRALINSSHWYNTLSVDKKIILIKNSSSFAVDAIDEAIGSTKLPEMIRHLENLKLRIVNGIILLPKVTDKKIVRFPDYDISADRLFGKGYRFITLWSHCYSDKLARKSIGRKMYY